MEVSTMKDTYEETPDDVYSVIRSAEVRDFLRNEAKLGILKEGEIILHSYISVQQKITMLKQLSDKGNEEEARQINEVHSILSEYMNQIYNPTVRTIFLLEHIEPYLDGTNLKEDSEFVDAYDTVDELIINALELYSQDGSGMYLYGLVSVIQVPQDEKLRHPFAFTVFWIDGKWQIKDIYIYDEERLKAQGISEDTLMMLDRGGTARYPLPFEDGCRLKLQLPFMDEPFYGILSSVNADEWYHNLYDENDPEGEKSKRISFSYAEINLCSGYSSLDWIERA